MEACRPHITRLTARDQGVGADEGMLSLDMLSLDSQPSPALSNFLSLKHRRWSEGQSEGPRLGGEMVDTDTAPSILVHVVRGRRGSL